MQHDMTTMFYGVTVGHREAVPYAMQEHIKEMIAKVYAVDGGPQKVVFEFNGWEYQVQFEWGYVTKFSLHWESPKPPKAQPVHDPFPVHVSMRRRPVYFPA